MGQTDKEETNFNEPPKKGMDKKKLTGGKGGKEDKKMSSDKERDLREMKQRVIDEQRMLKERALVISIVTPFLNQIVGKAFEFGESL